MRKKRSKVLALILSGMLFFQTSEPLSYAHGTGEYVDRQEIFSGVNEGETKTGDIKEEETEDSQLFEKVPEPVMEEITEPEPVTEEVTESEPEPVTEEITEPEPVTEEVTESEPEPVTEEVTESEPEPVTEEVTESEPEPVTEEMTESEPVTEEITESEPVTEEMTQTEPETSTEDTTETLDEKISIQSISYNNTNIKSGSEIYINKKITLCIKIKAENIDKIEHFIVNDNKIVPEYDGELYIIKYVYEPMYEVKKDVEFNIKAYPGECETKSQKFSLSYDNTKPVIKKIAYYIGEEYREENINQENYIEHNKNIKLDFFPEDEGNGSSGIDKIIIKNSECNLNKELKNGQYTYNFESIDDKRQIYTVCAYDKAGNCSDSYKLNILIDKKAPEMTIDGANKWINKESCIDVTLNDTSELKSLIVSKNNCTVDNDSIKDGHKLAADKKVNLDLVLKDKTYILIDLGSQCDKAEIQFVSEAEQNTIYYFKAYDELGNQTDWQQCGVMIDKTLPEITNFKFESYNREKIEIDKNEEGVFVFNKECDTDIDEDTFLYLATNKWIKAQISVKDVNGNEAGSGVAALKINGEDTIQVQEDIYSYTFGDSKSDEYSKKFNYSIEDKAGNKNDYDGIIEFIFDNKLPEIEFSIMAEQAKEADGKIYVDKHEKFARLDIKDRFLTSFEISSNDFKEKIENDEGKYWQCDTEAHIYDVSVSEDGEYQYEALATDIAGNVTDKVKSKIYVVDTTAPVLELTVDGNNKVNNFYNSNPIININLTELNIDTSQDNSFVKIKNITTDEEEILPIDKLGKVNGGDGKKIVSDGKYEVMAQCTDMVGNKTTTETVTFIVDTKKPVVEIVFNDDEPKNGMYYNIVRTAAITVEDMNFDVDKAEFDIVSDKGGSTPQIEKWEHISDEQCSGDVHGSACKHSCKVHFTKDGEYQIGFKATDEAGNVSDTIHSDRFIIDRTAPVISVKYDNNDVKNGKYYNKARTAEIVIDDVSFDSNSVKLVKAEGDNLSELPQIGSWTTSGTRHYAKVLFGEDGKYAFDISCTDLALNEATKYMQDEFIIDTISPEIIFAGVADNSANNGVVAPELSYTDLYLDTENIEITLTGTNHREGILPSNITPIENGAYVDYADIEHIREMDDFYRLKAHITDMAGNETEQELEFSVNRFGSTFRLDDDTQRMVDEYYIGMLPNVVITEINIDEITSRDLTLNHDGDIKEINQGRDYSVSRQGDDENWKSYTYNISADNFNKDGNYSVALITTDKASNSSDNRAKGLEIEFAVDTTAPSIIADGLESNGLYIDTEKTITLDVRDNMYLSELLVTNNGENILEMNESELAENTGVISFTLKESHEYQNIVITAIDIVGNKTILEYNDIMIIHETKIIEEKEVPHEEVIISEIPDIDNNINGWIVVVIFAVLVIAGISAYIVTQKRKSRE